MQLFYLHRNHRKIKDVVGIGEKSTHFDSENEIGVMELRFFFGWLVGLFVSLFFRS